MFAANKKLFFCLLISCGLLNTVFAQSDEDPNCLKAIPITHLSNYCSSDGQYSTTQTQIVQWLQFVAQKYDVAITVTGNTLTSPVIQLFADCAGNELVGTSTTSNNVTSFYKGGLIIGHTYYIAVTSGTGQPGTFKLCINNYNPIVTAGQDCATASLLCSTETFSQKSVSGAGANNDEGAGTCLANPGEASESNSVWYKWKAANNGTLVFTITPNKTTDDIDFALYDLDVTGDCANVNVSHVIRCAAGHGVDNIGCPNDPIYYKTGLDFNETDVSEAQGCGQGQNGKVKYITMQQGHYYALLVNNYSSQNNGFTMEFKDQQGLAGTGTFEGPKAEIAYIAVDTCTTNQQYAFSSSSSGYTTLKWSFGDGASTPTASSAGPYTITYNTPGVKTITLEAGTDKGCLDVAWKTINVALKPDKPVIKANKPSFCLQDTMVLSVDAHAGYTYHWTGPNNFTADSPVVYIPVNSTGVAGNYNVVESQLTCISETASISIPDILNNPQAAFDAQPEMPARLTIPLTVNFYNRSTGADSFLWDFGDGQTSTGVNPSHQYNQTGTYKVKLTAYNQKVCSSSTIKGDYVLLDNTGFYVPNMFTPNGDGYNDQFVINVANLNNFSISIFNRWGQQLFQSRSTFVNWDGNFNGKPVPAGVYYYLINATDFSGTKIQKSGYITLIR
jgi:gliding motility-associated-like protein